MGREIIDKCNVCSTVKLQTNHWYLLHMNAKIGTFALYPWQESSAGDPTYLHICGQACAHTKLDEFLNAPRRSDELAPTAS